MLPSIENSLKLPLKLGYGVKMKIQITIARFGNLKAISDNMCCHLLKNIISFVSKFGPQVRFKQQNFIGKKVGYFQRWLVLPSVEKACKLSSKLWE